MRLIDKIALNRLLAIIADFIIALAKIFAPHVKKDGSNNDDDNDGRWFPNLRKALKRKKK